MLGYHQPAPVPYVRVKRLKETELYAILNQVTL